MEPLAERLRPRRLEDYIGQEHLVGEGAVLRRMIDSGHVASFILWGPPGVGKTTLAQIIAQRLETPFFTLSAVTSGVKDVREVIERAQSNRFFNSASPILFIDEIHRFSKSQQDSLLGGGGEGDSHPDWCHNREPFLRGDTSVALSLPTLCVEIIGEGRPAEALAQGSDRGCRTEKTAYRVTGDGCHPAL